MKSLNTKFIIAALAIMTLASCSSDEALFTSTEVVLERIDLTIDAENNANNEFIFRQNSDANGQNDLVDFNYFGEGANQIEFKINLDDSRTLVISMLNENQANPWMFEGESYNIYASQDHEDKQRYVTARIFTNGLESTFVSNNGISFPRSAHLDVFRILNVDLANNEIHCRLIDLPMVDVRNNNEETIMINGTFRGSLSFLQ